MIASALGVPRTTTRKSEVSMSTSPSGATAEGETPGCWGAMRTLSAPGRLRRTSGDGIMSASPSTPTGMSASEVTAYSGDVQRPTRRGTGPGAAESRDPENASVHSWAGSLAEDPAQPVGVVRHKEHRDG